MIEFKDCDLIIGKTGILAESISLDVNANLQPNYIAGYSKSKLVPTANLTSAIQFNYTFDVLNDPFMPFIESSKNPTFVLTPLQIEVAGLKFTAFLQSFQISLEPNSLARASASLICYTPNSGFLSRKRGVVNYNKNAVSAGHAWSSFITSSGTYLNVPTYGFSYFYEANYNPIYTLGSVTPTQVILLKGREEAKIVREEWVSCTFSGEEVTSRVLSPTAENSFELYELFYEWEPRISRPLRIDLRECQISTVNLNASQGDFLRIAVNIQRNF